MSVNASEYSPLVLAYVGDSVYEQYIRTRLVEENPSLPAHKLHRAAIRYVSATAQSKIIGLLEDSLNEKELSVFKRGRNAKSPTSAKNSTILDYRRATGFEALVGFLYLDEQTDRLREILAFSFEHTLTKD